MQEQHPVPQQISTYQFRLVGDMTLKQFLELAGGALVGLFFYASAIPALFKWPLIIISVLVGVALAFLPLEDRPLEVWILAFFKSIYSPTLFYWRKTNRQYFQDESVPSPPLNIIAPQGNQKLNEYLGEKPESKNPFFANMEKAEKVFLDKVGGLFSQISPKSNTQPQMQPQPAGVQPNATASLINPSATQSTQTTSQTILPSSGAQTVMGSMEQTSQPVQNTPQTQQPHVPIPKAEALRVTPTGNIMDNKISEAPVELKEASVTPTMSVNKDIDIIEELKQVQFSQLASPPLSPTQPNTLSGQVLDAEGHIVESAILEIKDSAGRPVRAVKTNTLGHFFIVTPLANGTYEIITEKSGYTFDHVKFVASGQIIPPIAIRGRVDTAQHAQMQAMGAM